MVCTNYPHGMAGGIISQIKRPARNSFLDPLTRFLYSQQRKTQPLLVDMNYDGVTVGGSDIYYSWVSFQDNTHSTNATLISYVNTTRNQNTVVILPYTVTETGDALFGDGMKKFPAELACDELDRWF